MKNGTVFMFAGQGSQYIKMGYQLYKQNSSFFRWMNMFDEIYQDETGNSVIRYLYDFEKKKNLVFDNLMYSSPAIYMTEVSLAKMIMEIGIMPDAVVGTSLGELAAAAIAGVMPEEEIMKFIIKQSELIMRNCVEGGMMAVLDDPELFSRLPILHNNLELIAMNFERHFVVSGGKNEIEQASKYLKENQILQFQLPVRYAFHSSLIDNIKKDYIEIIKEIVRSNSKIRYVSGMSGELKEDFESDYFWNVVRQPMEFPKAISNFNAEESVFIDISPSGTLENFLKNILKKNDRIFSIMSVFQNDMDKLDQLKNTYFYYKI